MTPTALPWSHPLRVTGALIWIDIKEGLRKHLSGSRWRSRALQTLGLTFGLGFFAVLHACAWGLLAYTANTPSVHPADLLAGVSASVWGFLLFVMLSGGLMRALVVLHEQDDSALLLSSPASPRAVLAARLFGNALQSCFVDGFIIIPWIDLQTFYFGQPRFLCGFIVWFAVAVVVTCVDGLFSFGLIRLLGMRRARIFSQAIPFALVFGVTFFAGTMSLSIARLNTGSEAYMPATLQSQFLEVSHTPLAVLARAAAGSVPEFIAIIAGATIFALITLRLTERTFVEGTQNVAENLAPAAPGRADGPFRGGVFGLEVRKNLRLVLRTPMMLVQCLAQILTPVGIAFVLAHDDIGRAVAFFTIFAIGVLAGIVTIAAGTVEECDDLLQMAPRDYRRFRFGKIAAGCIVPVAVALVVGIVLLLMGDLFAAGAVLFGGIPLAVTSAIGGESFAKPVRPGQRPKLLADPIMMIPLLAMQIVSGLVAGLTVFAAAFSGWFLLGALGISYILLAIGFGLAQLRKPLF